MPRPEQLRMPPAPASDLPVPGGNRTTDTAAEATSAPTPLQPAEPATAPQTGTSEAAADTSGEVAPNAQTAIAEAPPKKPIVVPGPETEPTAVASLAVEAMPDDAADRSEGGILSEPPLPRARPAVSGVKHVWHAQAARAADERPRNIAALRPRRARVVVVRSVRAVRFTEPYYAQTQYAQNIDQSYGYGESSFQGAQQQVVIRRVVRFHPARLAARKVNAAIGGPFVSVRSP